MVSLLESCTIEERCLAFEKKYEDLVELRENLREWLKASPYLPQEIPDGKLELFLLNSKLSLEKAKEKVDMHYTLRRLVPEIFADRDPVSIVKFEFLKSMCFVPLPKLTPEKNRICFMKTGHLDNVDFNLWDFYKYTFMLADIRVVECRSRGDIYIYDLSGMRLSHLMQTTPTMIKKLEMITLKAYGPQIVGIHFINAPSFMDHLISLLKSTVKQKIIERIQVHTSLESLYNNVPKSLLPVDYGGDQLSTDELHKKWLDKLIDWRDWFIKEEDVLTNEALRPGPTVNSDNLFGTYGSFRKLDVD